MCPITKMAILLLLGCTERANQNILNTSENLTKKKKAIRTSSKILGKKSEAMQLKSMPWSNADPQCM
jgi:hypothetical protein